MEAVLKRIKKNPSLDAELEVDDAVEYWHDEYQGELSLFDFLGLAPHHYNVFLKDFDDFLILLKEDPYYD